MHDVPKGDGVSSELAKSHAIQDLTAQHQRVVALRVAGKRWSEIAAELGVTAWTIWHWRTEHPQIDLAIAEESNDYLVSTRHHFASLLPLGAKAMREILDAGNVYAADQNDPNVMVLVNAKDRIAATKLIVEIFSQRAGSAGAAATGTATSAAVGSAIAQHRTAGPVITDAELERVLDAELSEPDRGSQG